MPERSRRALLLGLALVMIVCSGAGCFGPFDFTRAVYDLNKDVSSSIVVQEIVFLAFLLVPVYEIALFVDAFVLNIVHAVSDSDGIFSHPARAESCSRSWSCPCFASASEASGARRASLRGWQVRDEHEHENE